MSQPSMVSSRAWWVVLLCALGILGWSASVGIRRAEYVTGIGQDLPQIARGSLTGFVGGTRELIVPEHVSSSYEWIEQTQLMFAHREWRVRTVDYENAPIGRTVHAASLYRWWLGAVAWADHLIFGHPLGLSVENVALYADPLLHFLFVLVFTVLIGRRFGSLAASLFAIGAVLLFPLAGAFVPGAPDDFGLTLVVEIASVLLLMVGLARAGAPVAGAQGGNDEALAESGLDVSRWFFLAGVVGGGGLWLATAEEAPIVLGISLGGVWAALAGRKTVRTEPWRAMGAGPWRAWSLGGAAAILCFYLVEYSPGHLGELGELRVIHPLYGLAWLGCGELVARVVGWAERPGPTPWTLRDGLSIALALLGVASIPLAMWKANNAGIFAVDLLSFRLTRQPDGVMAPNLAGWISSDGVSSVVAVTLLPLLLLIPAFWLVARRETDPRQRRTIALVLGPVLIAVALAYFKLRWWETVDGMLLLLLIPVTLAVCRTHQAAGWQWLWASGVLIVIGLGGSQLFPQKDGAGKFVVTLPEVESLVERDLAHWLAKRAGSVKNGIVLAPPRVTNTLYYYGGLRGIGSLSWENKDGLSVALRIAISTSPEEAHELVRHRGIDYIVVPSWDPFFETYTHSASVQTGELFLSTLHHWSQPTWLRPIPYQLPSIPGFEQQSVIVFEVVEDQGDALALSHLMEYFAEMGQTDNAKAAAQALRRFPMDFGALVARTELEATLGDPAEFTRAMDSLLKRLTAGADRGLPWGLRVSLAGTLARANHPELAKAQIQRCLAEIDESRLRSLTPYSLYHLELLLKASGLEIKDRALRELALDLTSPELRGRL